MKKYDATWWEWEDIVHDGEKGHFLKPNVWQLIQEKLINIRTDNNTCAAVVAPYSYSKVK